MIPILKDAIQKAEETRQLEVIRIGIPDLLGFHRDGSPVWFAGNSVRAYGQRAFCVVARVIGLSSVVIGWIRVSW